MVGECLQEAFVLACLSLLMETCWALPQYELSLDWCKQMNSDWKGQTSLDLFSQNQQKKVDLQIQCPPHFRSAWFPVSSSESSDAPGLFICMLCYWVCVCMLHVYVNAGMCVLVCMETRGWRWLFTYMASYLIFCYKFSGWVWGSPVRLTGQWAPGVLLSPSSQISTTAPRFSLSSDPHAKPTDATVWGVSPAHKRGFCSSYLKLTVSPHRHPPRDLCWLHLSCCLLTFPIRSFPLRLMSVPGEAP